MHDAILPPDPLEEMERNKKMEEYRKKEGVGERRSEKKKRRREEKKKKKQRERTKKRIFRAIKIVLGVLIPLIAIIFFVLQQEVLPPTSSRGHSEDVPPAHILREPIPLTVFLHMIEHADGFGPPGIIISYNCISFECEPGFVEQLEDIARDYPEQVYVAPFPGMTARLVITQEGRQEVFEEIDEEKIRSFIEQR